MKLLMHENVKIYSLFLFLIMAVSGNVISQTRKVDRGLINFNGTMNLSGGYLREDQFNRELFYSNIGANSIAVVNGVPLSFNWNVMQSMNNKFRTGNFSMGFSKESFESYLFEKGSDSLVHSAYASQLDSLAGRVNGMEYLGKVSEARRNLNIHLRDSIIGIASISSVAIDSARVIVNEYDSLRRIINNIYRNRSINVKADILNRIHTTQPDSTINYSNSGLDSNAVPKEIGSVKNIYDSLNKFQKLVSVFDRIQLGDMVINQSWISVYNYSLFGENIKLKKSKYFIESIYGKHRRFSSSSSFDMMHSLSFSNELNDNQSMYQIGGGINDSSGIVSLSYSGFSMSAETSLSDNLNQKKIGLINFRTMRHINNDFHLQAEVSKVVESDSEISLAKSGEDVALDLTAEKEFIKCNLNVRAGYLKIGDAFYNPGNMYLMNNLQTLKLRVEKLLFASRLSASAELTHSWSGLWKRDLVSVQLAYSLSSRTELSVRSMYSGYYLKDFNSQILYYNMLTFSSRITSNLSVGTNLSYGIGDNGPNTGSRDILLGGYSNFQYGKSSINIQANKFIKQFATVSMEGYSLSLGYNIMLARGFSAGCTQILQVANGNKSLGLLITSVYPIAKRLSLNFSIQTTSYFKRSVMSPNSVNYLAQGMMSFCF